METTEMKSYRQFGNLEDSQVVGHGADNDSDFAITAILLHVSDQPGQRHRRSVDFGHEETTEHNLVELGIGSSGQKAIQLD